MSGLLSMSVIVYYFTQCPAIRQTSRGSDRTPSRREFEARQPKRLIWLAVHSCPDCPCTLPSGIKANGACSLGQKGCGASGGPSLSPADPCTAPGLTYISQNSVIAEGSTEHSTDVLSRAQAHDACFSHDSIPTHQSKRSAARSPGGADTSSSSHIALTGTSHAPGCAGQGTCRRAEL